MDSEALTIPIYLDTNTLIDLLASMEDGFSTVENYTARTSGADKNEHSQSVSSKAGFNIPNVLELFKIELSGTGKKTVETQTGEERQLVKYHTYGSLLNRLRTNLVNAGLLKRITDESSWNNISASDFVEIRGTFTPNPLYASLQKINKVMDLAAVFSNAGALSTGQKKPDKGNPQKGSTDIKTIRNFFLQFIGELEPEGMQTYVVGLDGLPEHKIVVSLLKDYNRDRSNTELPGGNFRMLGKVIRKVNNDESIDLLRGTGLSGINEDMLKQVLTAFEQMGQQGLNVETKISTKVKAPAIQIIPIAIYV